MLPFEIARWTPMVPDQPCFNCKRWAEIPDQTWGIRTPCFSTFNSCDVNCKYIAITQDATKGISEMS